MTQFNTPLQLYSVCYDQQLMVANASLIYLHAASWTTLNVACQPCVVIRELLASLQFLASIPVTIKGTC